MRPITVAALGLAVAVGCQPFIREEAGVIAPEARAETMTWLDAGPTTHIIRTPGQLQWSPGPPSLAAGAQMVVLEGNPTEAGHFTMRLRLPEGYVIAPHSHTGVERLTVISGTFMLGQGDTFDRANLQRLEAGSYFAMPRNHRHFATVEGETVVQISTIGPWQINYVRPQDDPRNR